MEEAECNRRGESKILTVFMLFIIEFLSLYHTLKPKDRFSRNKANFMNGIVFLVQTFMRVWMGRGLVFTIH